jgi:phenylacetate-CoA ligase
LVESVAEPWVESLDELRDLQLERLQTALGHAYENVPFYRRSFDAAGVHPDDCKSLADLAKFPMTTKADLRDNYPFGMLAVDRSKIARVHASSGTTGKPTIVSYTRHDLDVWSSVMARSLSVAGVRAGQMVQVSTGYGLFTGGLGQHYGAERLGCAVIPASGGATARQVQMIDDLRPDAIFVTTTYMLTILDEFERQGLDPAASSLQVAICGGEPWTEAMRSEIEARGGLDALDLYGLSEVIGPGVAMESPVTKDGPHIWEDHFYPEIIFADGSVLPDGSPGELVLTSLTREGMPVIRYRTRDLTRLLPGTACPPFRRMQMVTGRSDDLIILRGVNVFPTQIEEIVLGTPGLAPHFQLLRTRSNRMDELTVVAEAAADADTARRDLAAAAVKHAVKGGIGVRVEVLIVDPGTLERSTGKLRRVIDKREP